MLDSSQIRELGAVQNADVIPWRAVIRRKRQGGLTELHGDRRVLVFSLDEMIRFIQHETNRKISHIFSLLHYLGRA